MERVTYPSEVVQRALKDRYQRVVLDVEADAQTAGKLKPEVIPTAVILTPDGVEQSRLTGFADADTYAKWLK